LVCLTVYTPNFPTRELFALTQTLIDDFDVNDPAVLWRLTSCFNSLPRNKDQLGFDEVVNYARTVFQCIADGSRQEKGNAEIGGNYDDSTVANSTASPISRQLSPILQPTQLADISTREDSIALPENDRQALRRWSVPVEAGYPVRNDELLQGSSVVNPEIAPSENRPHEITRLKADCEAMRSELRSKQLESLKEAAGFQSAVEEMRQKYVEDFAANENKWRAELAEQNACSKLSLDHYRAEYTAEIEDWKRRSEREMDELKAEWEKQAQIGNMVCEEKLDEEKKKLRLEVQQDRVSFREGLERDFQVEMEKVRAQVEKEKRLLCGELQERSQSEIQTLTERSLEEIAYVRDSLQREMQAEIETVKREAREDLAALRFTQQADYARQMSIMDEETRTLRTSVSMLKSQLVEEEEDKRCLREECQGEIETKKDHVKELENLRENLEIQRIAKMDLESSLVAIEERNSSLVRSNEKLHQDVKAVTRLESEVEALVREREENHRELRRVSEDMLDQREKFRLEMSNVQKRASQNEDLSLLTIEKLRGEIAETEGVFKDDSTIVDMSKERQYQLEIKMLKNELTEARNKTRRDVVTKQCAEELVDNMMQMQHEILSAQKQLAEIAPPDDLASDITDVRSEQSPEAVVDVTQSNGIEVGLQQDSLNDIATCYSDDDKRITADFRPADRARSIFSNQNRIDADRFVPAAVKEGNKFSASIRSRIEERNSRLGDALQTVTRLRNECEVLRSV